MTSGQRSLSNMALEDQSRSKLNEIVVHWAHAGVAFEGELPGAHAITVDEPRASRHDSGASPTDLLLAAVATCSGISTISLTRKMRQPVRGLEITASGNRQEAWPKAFTKIHLRFVFAVGASADETQIEAAVERAVNRYCPVSATLQLGVGGCEITYDVYIASSAA